MLRESRKQPLDEGTKHDDGSSVSSPSVKKIDFNRKKAQTPKRKAAFTPLRKALDIKPKLEPDSSSSTIRNSADPFGASCALAREEEPAARVKVESPCGVRTETTSAEPGHTLFSWGSTTVDEDVKPDVNGLEALLDGLNIDRTVDDAPRRCARTTKEELETWTPAPVEKKSSLSTPLFLPTDSPASSALSRSPAQSTHSSDDAFGSPHRPTRGPVAQHEPAAVISYTADLGLFADDSPPPVKREIRSPASRVPQHEPAAISSSTADFGLFADDSPPPAKRDMWSPAPSASSAAEDDRQFSPSPSVDSRRASPASRPTISAPRAIATGPSRILGSKRRAFLDFLDTIEKSEDEEDVVAHLYDDGDSASLGSLKDFIVDDDEIEFGTDASDDESEDYSVEVPVLESHRVPDRKPSIDVDDSDIEEVKEARVPGRAKSVKQDHSIRYESSDTHDEASDAPNSDHDAPLRSPLLDVDSEDDDHLEGSNSPSGKRMARTEILLKDFLDSEDEDDDALVDALGDLDLQGRSPLGSQRKDKKVVKAPRWEVERVRIAQEVFDDLDKRVFEGRLGPEGAGAKIIWNKRLLTTAGTAQRKKRRHSDGNSSWDVGIQLSEKVCTGEEQILSTVAHEMCHLACWVIDSEFKNPHGKVFKSWGRKVMRKRSDLEVTTKHDYIIEYKFQWQCVGCRKVYKRHSRSIDIEKQGCGICRGKLELMFETKQRVSNPFQLYLKQNMATAKAALPGASHGEVMRALSARWADAGAEGDHESHWKAVLAASRL